MNSETQQNDLQAQVLHLQKELRQLRLFALSSLAVLAAAVLLHIHEQRKLKTSEVVANEITLTDADGHPRARLAVFPEGSGLETYAPSGERDVAGNRAVVGVPQSPDLNTEDDSAASLILKHRSGRNVQIKPTGVSH